MTENKKTIGRPVKGYEDSIVICENCGAHFEDNYASDWHDDFNYCPKCGLEIDKSDYEE